MYFAEDIPTSHEPEPITWSWGARLREACWEALKPPVRERLLDHAGEVICWWASDDAGPAGRPSAIVFGTRELCFAIPSFDGERPVHVLSGYILDPASARTLRIVPPHPEPNDVASGEGVREVDIGLADEVRGILGNLPPRAQTFLQGPFTGGRLVERHGWYAEGDEQNMSVFILYLAGANNVTVATGTRTVQQKNNGAPAEWDLTCHQARVIGRRGI